jgi:SAM-dependent methyltransferase
MSMSAAGPNDSQRAWASYWESGALHSLPGTYEGNYGGAIGRYWQTCLGGLNEPCHILDLATGNGPLPACLLTVNPCAHVHCTAVDLSPIAPAWWQDLPPDRRVRVRFAGQVDIGRLPLDDHAFDLVISQFGLEYGPRQQACGELARVLRPGGQTRLICHHSDSFLLQQARHERSHIAWILTDSGWFAAARDMLEPLSLSASAQGRAAMAGSARYAAIRERYSKVLQAAEARVHSSLCPDVLGEAGEAFAQCLRYAVEEGVQAGAQALARFEQTLRMSDQRLASMQSSALDETAAHQLLALLAASGVDARIQEFHDPWGLMGWLIEGKKTGA